MVDFQERRELIGSVLELMLAPFKEFVSSAENRNIHIDSNYCEELADQLDNEILVPWLAKNFK